MPGVGDLANVPSGLRTMALDTCRDDAVSVHFTSNNLPTSEEAGKMVDYDKKSEMIVPRYAHTRDFVAYTAVYGGIPFPHDPAVKRRNETSVAKMDFYTKPVHVYRFSNTAGFRGILSTVPDFHLVGFGYPLVAPGKRDLSKESLHYITLEKIGTEKDWYKLVAGDCGRQAVAWMAPITRYSPISNLPKMSKNAVMVMRAMVDLEEGVLIGNFAHVKNRTIVGKVVSDWDFEDDVPSSSRNPRLTRQDDASASTTSSSSTSSTASTQMTMLPPVKKTDEEDFPFDQDLFAQEQLGGEGEPPAEQRVDDLHVDEL